MASKSSSENFTFNLNSEKTFENSSLNPINTNQQTLLQEKKHKLLQQLKSIEISAHANSVAGNTVTTDPTECELAGVSVTGRRNVSGNGGNWDDEEEGEGLGFGESVEGNGIDGDGAGAGRGGGGLRRVYLREEMESMRYVDVEEQRRVWREVYDRLGSVVAREYDELVGGKSLKKGRRDRGRPGKNPENQVNDGVETQSSSALASSHNISDKDGMALEETSSYDIDSDEEYASIQRPAFFVEGEPNFDSGPPEDGLEYLRRVRWEAAQIPKVKVAKVDKSKFNKEQSDYMPKIPDIAECPLHLLPSKHWEDEFLADFSELRQSLSQLGESSTESQGKHPDIFFVNEKDWQPQPLETIITDNVSTLNVAEVVQQYAAGFMSGSSINNLSSVAGNACTPCSDTLIPKVSVSEASDNNPTLSAILSMDTVTRSTTLKKRIRLAESLNSLSRNDCMWLFALCAAVDTPLHADTSAALRSLLRKCASLRAEKSDLDDEVIMLNILATIAGKYFGQSER